MTDCLESSMKGRGDQSEEHFKACTFMNSICPALIDRGRRLKMEMMKLTLLKRKDFAKLSYIIVQKSVDAEFCNVYTKAKVVRFHRSKIVYLYQVKHHV